MKIPPACTADGSTPSATASAVRLCGGIIPISKGNYNGLPLTQNY